MENNRSLGDSQVVEELATNERVLEYKFQSKNRPAIKVRFKYPTLQIQRKIDTGIRAKKKYLREAIDKIEDPDSPNGYRIVPAYKSRQVLAREFEELGWWTPDMDTQLEELTNKYAGSITRLEILGFESYDAILDNIDSSREDLIAELDLPEEEKDKNQLLEHVLSFTMPGAEPDSIVANAIRDAASSTKVDDIMKRIELLHEQFKAYADMVQVYAKIVELEKEKNSLFSDSWQSQLEYHTKIMQVFYCTEDIETNKPLYESTDDLEKEEDTQFIGWLFSELQALWQGLSDESRERLGKYSFTSRAPSEQQSSEELPVPAESKADGDTPSETPSTSTKVSDTKESLPLFNSNSSNG